MRPEGKGFVDRKVGTGGAELCVVREGLCAAAVAG